MSFERRAHRRPPTVQLAPVAAVVTAVSGAGIFATPVGQDEERPVGPCRGPRKVGATPIAPGMHVLLVFSTTGPWIVSVDE